MASFVIHTISGEQFLNKLEETYNITISDYNKKQFLLGNLIVDSLKTDKSIPKDIKEPELTQYKMAIKTKIREEKLTTHFRDKSRENECIKTPIPENFLLKYQDLIDDNFSVLGYLFHLYTDKLFFSTLFTDSFDTIDELGNHTDYDKNLKYIKVKKSNSLVDAASFWSGTDKINIYNDYTIINSLLLEEFGTSFNKEEFLVFAKEHFHNPGITEVDFSKIAKLINDTQSFIEESYNNDNKELSVFTESQIINFIPYVVEQFMIEYKSILKRFQNTKKKTK